MRAAPPVSVRAAGGLAWRAVQSLLPALAAGACGVWAAQRLALPLWPAALLAAIAGALGWWLAPPVPVELTWDGRRWTADGTPAQPLVAIDLGRWLLLRLQAGPGTESRPLPWVAVAEREAGGAWHALRCALYAAPGREAERAIDGAAV